MGIDMSGKDILPKAGSFIIRVENTHPLLLLSKILPWEALMQLVESDLQKTTSKGMWWTGRKIMVRLHLGAYLLQKLYNLTDRKTEYQIKDNAAFQLFSGRGISALPNKGEFSFCPGIHVVENERQKELYSFTGRTCSDFWREHDRYGCCRQRILECSESKEVVGSQWMSRGTSETGKHQGWSCVGFGASRSPPKSSFRDRGYDWIHKARRATGAKQNEERQSDIECGVWVYPWDEFEAIDQMQTTGNIESGLRVLSGKIN
jgi:hypothetical protein